MRTIRLNIVFRNGDGVFVTEVENYGQPVVHEITQIKKNSFIAFNNTANALFVLEAKSGHLTMIKLGPKNFTLSIPSKMNR